MYRSTSYASQSRKSAFVEMAERSAEATRLLQEMRTAQTEGAAERKRSVVQWAMSKAGHLLRGQRDGARQRPAAASS